MNLRQLRDACRYRLAEVSGTFFTDPMLTQWLNDALMEFATETKIIQRRKETDVLPTVRPPLYPMDPDFFQVNTLRVGDRTLKPASPYFIEQHAQETGDPRRYAVVGQQILLWPQPTRQELMVCWYYARPQLLVRDEDVPEIPEVYHHRLVAGACYAALLADREFAGADRMKAEWEQAKLDARRMFIEQTEQSPVVEDRAGYGVFLDPW